MRDLSSYTEAELLAMRDEARARKDRERVREINYELAAIALGTSEREFPKALLDPQDDLPF